MFEFHEAVPSTVLRKLVKENLLKDDLSMYSRWRSWFLQYVHQTTAPFAVKAETLLKCIEDNPLMASIKKGGQVNFERYRYILEELESIYGQQAGLLSAILLEVQNAKKIKLGEWKNIHSMAQLLTSYLARYTSDGYGGEPHGVHEIVFPKLDKALQDQYSMWIGMTGRKVGIQATCDFLNYKAKTTVHSYFMDADNAKGEDDSKKKEKTGSVHLTSSEDQRESDSEQKEESPPSGGKKKNKFTRLKEKIEGLVNQVQEMQTNNGKQESSASRDGNEERGSSDQTNSRRDIFDPNEHRPRQDRPPTRRPGCVHCSRSHFLARCQEYLDLLPPKRLDLVKHYKLCMNCLIYGHTSRDCRSTWRCQECERKHHTSLHGSWGEGSSPGGNGDSSNNGSRPPFDPKNQNSRQLTAGSFQGGQPGQIVYLTGGFPIASPQVSLGNSGDSAAAAMKQEDNPGSDQTRQGPRMQPNATSEKFAS